jgi:hypothetical protein
VRFACTAYLTNVRLTDSVLSSNAVTQNILSTGLKPSFILWDKLYRKFVAEDDCIWLVRAVSSVALHESGGIVDNAHLWCVASFLVNPC